MFQDHFLKQLEKRVLECKECPCHKTRKLPVTGAGDVNADIMIISELPGPKEADIGVPMSGASRATFETVMKILEYSVYTTYIQKCQGEDALSTHFNTCLHHVNAQIDIIKPKVLCTTGIHATKCILKSFEHEDHTKTLEELHGNGLLVPEKTFRKKVVRHKLYVVPTYNFAVDNSIMKSRILEDIHTINKLFKLKILLFD